MELNREYGKSHFIEKHCRIHGRYNGRVYRRKRNGEAWVYDYEYKPRYKATVLSRRSNCVLKAASGLTNPQYKNFSAIINKLYYYTPYLVYAGQYSFCCNTFLKLRQRGEYRLQNGDMSLELNLAPRTRLKLSFSEEKTYHIHLYQGENEYCSREVVVINPETDLESAYCAWFDEHLEQILQRPEPGYAPLKKYRRGIEPPVWIQNFGGIAGSEVLYARPNSHFVYIRSAYEHDHTAAGNWFYTVQPRIISCWQQTSRSFRSSWKRYHSLWFKALAKREKRRVDAANLWSFAVYRAGWNLGFDLRTISSTNWLPGVEDLSDLLCASGLSQFSLSAKDLGREIYC